MAYSFNPFTGNLDKVSVEDLSLLKLQDLSDVDKTDKATSKILQVRADGKHEYVTLPNPDLTPYWKSDGGSTATGDWDLGVNDFSATNGDFSGYLTVGGNVGIGTDSPSEKLDVVGNGTFSGTLVASNLSGSNTGDQDLSGYVPYIGATCSVNLNNKTLVNVNALGVGTDTPSYDVDVMGTGATSIVNSNNGFRTLTVDNPSGGFGTRTVQDGGSLEASKLYYYQITYVTAVGETASYPNQSGTVTTTATDKSVLLEGLPVSSDYRVITKNIYRTKADASQYTYYLVDSIPNATTSYLDTKADESLDTDKQSYFRDNTTSIFLKNGDVTIFAPGETTYRSGYNVGNDVTNSGRSAYAGASVASIGSQGSDNAMFGYGIGYNATFSLSVAMGTYVFGALSSSHTQATGIGYGTLFGAYGQSRSINYSTAVGYQAGGAGCPYLTAVGNSAGGALQGSANSFVGAYAGKGASGATAASNSGIGFYVLNGLTTGYGNVGIGRDSGKANTSGSYNSYLGSFSASNQTTGSYNAYLGFAAGRYSTDQSYELFINSYDRTDRAGDIAKSIIYGIQTSAGTGQELYLNSSVFVKEDVKAVGDLTVGGNVGIGTTSPSAKLEVNSTAWVDNVDTDAFVVTFPTTSSATTGAVRFGKMGTSNEAVGFKFQQVSGTDRLLFRGSSTPGAIVWSQPEAGAKLYIDIPSRSYIISAISIEPQSSQTLGTVEKPWATIYGNDGDFSGDLTVDGDLIVDTDTLFVDQSSGYVGIGTDSPSEELHVVGSIEIENNSNNCKIIVDADATCDTGTKIAEDNSIALCLSCS